MADDQPGTTDKTSDGGVAAKHAPAARFELLAGPTTSDQYNRVSLREIPVACWRVDDIRFAFDSSFVNADPTPDNPNDIRAELAHLVELIKEHPGAPLSVFGHADPVGDDAYNKKLSGWRAMVIYGLLIAQGDLATGVKLWQQVATEEKWGTEQWEAMQQLTGLSSATPHNALIEAYIKKLCPPELKLTKTDFLARGADANGKGDYQGCSEFNPVLLFSQEKQQDYDKARSRNSADDQPVIEEQNRANAPNRRVLVLLFRKGSQVDPAKWPCPIATGGEAVCKSRFWRDGAYGPDGEKRRSTHLPGKQRKFDDSKDTFGCRFYQRITDDSPCHQLAPEIPCYQKSFPPRPVDRPIQEVISNAPPPDSSWNGTYTWHSKFDVVVTRNPCQIKVILKIKLTGTITDQQKAAWKSAIETKWNNKVTLYCSDSKCVEACPDGYPVVIDLEYVTTGEHQVVQASPSTSNMKLWGVNDTVDITHEFGHMLGNPEEYFTTNGVNYVVTVNGVTYRYRSPNGNIMNNPANDPIARHYDIIRQEAGQAMKIGCYFDPYGPGDFPGPPGKTRVA
jgi:hypothetical protein